MACYMITCYDYCEKNFIFKIGVRVMPKSVGWGCYLSKFLIYW